MTDFKEEEIGMRDFLDDALGVLDDEQVKAIHQSYKVSNKLTYDEIRLSRKTHIVICYDYIRLHGDYGFLDESFGSREAMEYFSKMKDFSGKSFEDIIDATNYEYHFHPTTIKGKIKEELKKEFGKHISFDDLIVHHFALYTEDRADRATGKKSPRIHFLLGKYGMVYILFYDPYHELC